MDYNHNIVNVNSDSLANPTVNDGLLRAVYRSNGETWGSLEPMVIPQQMLVLIEEIWEHVDFHDVGKWNHDYRANDINWLEFLVNAEALLKIYNKAYMIKAALAVTSNE